MAKQQELDSVYMGTALLHAKLSKARRSKAGATLVTKQGVVLSGFNGTAIGRTNNCEILRKDFINFPTRDKYDWLESKTEVVHAELNCILKAAREGVSCLGATVYTSLSPCVPCSAMLVNAGISRLVFKDTYRDTEGLQLLESCGIITEQYVEKYSDEIIRNTNDESKHVSPLFEYV